MAGQDLFGNDTLKAKRQIEAGGKKYDYYSFDAVKEFGDIARLPKSLMVLLENLLRFEDGKSVTVDDIKALSNWTKNKDLKREIAYHPARVLMQDFTGVPGVVDLAAMRDAVKALGGDPQKINPLTPVDLVIDHSVSIDKFGTSEAFEYNVAKEFERNKERYEFLKWGQGAFKNFRVVPPGTGICHQVNLEYLGQVVWTNEDGGTSVAYPDTLVGTDSHTTMINGLAILGWGVGGIEAEAAMLGQPISMLIPEVVGFKLKGKLKEGTTATDLVLTVTQELRKLGVVGKFVEFYGPGLNELTLADRATIANMAPEYGATCGFFPIDQETINYMKFTGRDPERVELVEKYAKAQGMWREDSIDPEFNTTMELDISTVEPSLAGPRRPQDRITLSDVPGSYQNEFSKVEAGSDKAKVEGADYSLSNGDVVIAAITSCTNTSNPSVMIAAGLVAKKAIEKGIEVKPWVKTSLAPGSQVVSDYLNASGLQKDLDACGFNLVGYGCTTCIGNSGPLPENISKAIESNNLVACSVLSGNRNFEGRVNPQTRFNYLASPPLVVAYALAGNMKIDVFNDPISQSKDGKDVFLKDIWPTHAEVQGVLRDFLTSNMYKSRYANVFEGPKQWQEIKTSTGLTYDWVESSTYVKNPPFFEGMKKDTTTVSDIEGARILALLGDSTTTDHISPAGAIKEDSPAGDYLKENGVSKADFNSFGSRRGNHEVMMRGTFGNIRLRNELAPGTEGGVTRFKPSNEEMSIFDASMKYQAEGTPLVVIAGQQYGMGSSRDWAAKGTTLLGVRAVIAESFERIHRSNLIGMGVLPLEFEKGVTRSTLGLSGDEKLTIRGLSSIKPRSQMDVEIETKDGNQKKIAVNCRIDTIDELEYYRNGGILHYVLRNLVN